MVSLPPAEIQHPPAQPPPGLSFAALLVLLPGLLPACGLLAWSPYPRIDGSGLVYLAALPLAYLAARRHRAQGAVPVAFALLALLVVFGAAALVGAEADALGAERARVLLAAGLLAFLGGAALRSDERITLVAGLAVLGLGFGLPALALGLAQNELGWSGVLGNPGPLNQVLVPAGAAGLALLTRVHGTRARILAALAFGVATLHATLAPVHAGLASLLVAGFAVTLFSTVKASARVVPFVLSILLGLLLFTGVDREPQRTPVAETAPSGAQAVELGGPTRGAASGLAVRASIARASFGLWRAEGAVGAGQFQAAFPPFREVEETEHSRDGVCMGGIREVEHPHDDWLLGFIELGLPGGLAWITLLVLGAVRAALALRRGAAHDAALAAGLIALLVNAGVHAPLLVSPASSVLGFVLLGAVVAAQPAGTGAHAPRRAGAWMQVGVGVALLASLAFAPRALALWSHGRALTRAAAALSEVQALEERGIVSTPEEAEPTLERLQAALDDALDSSFASALALRLSARFSPAVLRGQESGAELWQALLAQQPHSFEALYELGLARARAGEDEAARAHWEAALALQPTHPVLLRNLARLAFHAGDDAVGEAHLTLVQRNGCLEAGWTASLGEELTLAGRVTLGRALLARDEPRLAGAEAAWIDALGREARQAEQTRRADALSLIANLVWAREHAAEEGWGDAVRLYRQALNRSRRHLEGGATALRLELGAAALRAGQIEEARVQLAGLAPRRVDVRDLPEWARARIELSGLVELPQAD